MPSMLHPYLNFRDNTREAMEFYREVFGGELNVATFGESNASQDPADANKVMHAELTAPNGIRFMASDTPDSMEYAPGSNFAMSLSGDDGAELRGYFEKLAERGEVTMPLAKAPWGDTFGMCKDRFGTSWLVNISGASS